MASNASSRAVKQKFTLFSPQGVPLRATLSVILREYKTLEEQLAQLNLMSPDRTHSHVVQSGETVAALAARFYQNPGNWRFIADSNQLQDPRRLETGTFLTIPPSVRSNMLELVTLKEESARQGGFYVPRFEIKVAGASLPRDVLRDVMQVTYKDSVKELDSFEIAVNNWDTAKKQFKYVGAETPESLKKNPLHNLFNPCGHEVDLFMGYGANPLTLMLKGNFVTMEPSFPSGGGSTLAVRVLKRAAQVAGESTRLCMGPTRNPATLQKVFLDLPPDSKDVKAKRFPLKVDTEGNDINGEPDIAYIAQSNQSDIEFLLALARSVGYVIFVKEEEQIGNNPKERRLYFGPSDGNHPGFRLKTFELKWGLSLIDFKPTLTTANQIKSVTVNGWDRKTKQPIRGVGNS